jgi:transposase
MAMSEHVNGTERDQTVFFPDTIEKYVDRENPVRFIDAFVDSLNMEKLGFKHSVLADTGRPSYNPSDLLKLCLLLPQPSKIKSQTGERMPPQR